MARFIRQFCVLFWKNLLSRLRQPVLLLSELIWPCLLFLILLGVRVQHPPRQENNCYVEPRTLPSGGLYPFVQSLFCDIGSKCHKVPFTDGGDVTQRSRSSLNSTADSGPNILPIIDLGNEIEPTTQQAFSPLDKIIELFGQSGAAEQLTISMDNLNAMEEIISIIERIHNETYTWEILFNLPNIMEILMNEDLLSRGINAVAEMMLNMKRLLESMKDLFSPTSENMYLFFDTIFNLTVSSLNIVQDVANQSTKLNLTLKSVLWNPEITEMVFKEVFKMDIKMNISIPLLKVHILFNESEFQSYICSEMAKTSAKPCLVVGKLLFGYIDQMKIIKQVFVLWKNNGLPEYLETKFAQMLTALMRYLIVTQDMDTVNSTQQIITLLGNFSRIIVVSENNASSEEIQNYQENLESLPQWNELKNILTADKLYRDYTVELIRTERDALVFLKKAHSSLGVNDVDRIIMEVDILISEIKMSLSQNEPITCSDLALKLKGVLSFTEEPLLTDDLISFTCGDRLPSDWNISEYFPSMKRYLNAMKTGVYPDIQVSVADMKKGWQEVFAAYESLMVESIYDFTKNMTMTSELWKNFEFSTFQQHLLWNLAFDMFEVQGYALESTNLWPSIEKYIRGMCWVIENSNHPLTGNGSTCDKGKINWRNLLNETLVYMQNAQNDFDTLWFLNAILKFLNNENIIKLNADDIQMFSHTSDEDTNENGNIQGLHRVVKILLKNAHLWMNNEENETFSIMNTLVELFEVNNTNLFFSKMKVLMNHLSKGKPPEFKEAFNILLSELEKVERLIIGSPFQQQMDLFNATWTNLQKMLLHNFTGSTTESLNLFWNFTSLVWIGSTNANTDYVDFAKMFLHYLNNFGFLSEDQLSSLVDAISTSKNVSIMTSSTQNLSHLQSMEVQLFEVLEAMAAENKTELLEMFYDMIQAVLKMSNATDLSSLVTAFNNNSEGIYSFLDQFNSDDIGEVLETIVKIIDVFHNMSKDDLAENVLKLYLFAQSQIEGNTTVRGAAHQQINETIVKLTEAFHNNTNNISCLMLQALQSSSVPISDFWLKQYCSTHNTGRKIRSLNTGSNSQQSENLYSSLVEKMIIISTDTNRDMALSTLSRMVDLFLFWMDILKEVAVQMDLDFSAVNHLYTAFMQMSEELNQTSEDTSYLISNSSAALKIFLQNITSTDGFNLQNMYKMKMNNLITLQQIMNLTFSVPFDNNTFYQLSEVMENMFSLFQGHNIDAWNNISKFIEVLQPIWSLNSSQHEMFYSVLHTFANLNSRTDLANIKMVFREILEFYNHRVGMDHYVQKLQEFFNFMEKYENSSDQFPYKGLVVLMKQLILSTNPNTGEKEWGTLLQWLNVLMHTNLSDLSLSFLSNVTQVPIYRLNISEMDKMMRKTEETIFYVQNLTEMFNGRSASKAYYNEIISLLEMMCPNSNPYKNASIQVLKMSIELAYTIFNAENMSYALIKEMKKQIQRLESGGAAAEVMFGLLSKLNSKNIAFQELYLPYFTDSHTFPFKGKHNMFSLGQSHLVQYYSRAPEGHITLLENITNIMYNLTTILQSIKDIHSINKQLEQMNVDLIRIIESINGTEDICDNLTRVVRILKYIPEVHNMANTVNTIRLILLENGNENFLQTLTIISDGVPLIQNLTTMNVSEALGALYFYALAHQPEGLNLSQGNQVELNEKVIRLIEMVYISTNSPQCLPVAFCRLLSEGAPRNDSDPILKACNLDANQNLSIVMNLAADIKHFIAGTARESAKVECLGNIVSAEVIKQTGCVIQQYEKWNKILISLSQTYGLENPVLIKLQEIWDNFSDVIDSTKEDDINCINIPLRQADKLLALTHNKTNSEQIITFLSDVRDTVLFMSGNKSKSVNSSLNIITSYLKNTLIGLPLDFKKQISTLIYSVQSLISISDYKNEDVKLMLNDLLDVLNANINLVNLLETLSMDIDEILTDRMTNPEIKNLLPAVEKVINFLRNMKTGDFIDLDMLEFNATLNDVEEILKRMQQISNFTDENSLKVLNIIVYFLKRQNTSQGDIEMFVRSASLIYNISQDFNASGFDAYSKFLPYIFTVLSNENVSQSVNALQSLSDLVEEMYLYSDFPDEFQQVLVTQVTTILNQLMPMNNKIPMNYTNVISKILQEILVMDFDEKVNDTKIVNKTMKVMEILVELLDGMQGITPIKEATAEVFELFKFYFTEDLKRGTNFTSLEAICQFEWLNKSSSLQKMDILQLKLRKLFLEKLYFVNDIMCIQKGCGKNIGAHVIHILIEILNFTEKILEEMNSTQISEDCQNFVNYQKQMQSISNQAREAVINYNCTCDLTQSLIEQLNERIKYAVEYFGKLPSNSSVLTLIENIGTFQDLRIENYVENITTLKMQLMQIGNLSDETIDALLKANISLEEVILHALVAADRCDEKSLSLMCSFPKDVNISDVTTELCSLTLLDRYKLILTISYYINVRNIIYKAFLPLMMSSQEFQVMQNILDVITYITSLVPSNSLQFLKLIPEAMKSIRKLNLFPTVNLNENVQRRSVEISTSNIREAVFKGICQTKSSSLFRGSLTYSELPQIEEITEEDYIKYKIPTNTTPYCRDFYEDILKAQNGPLMWTFLKPLLLGEILYAPNSPEIQTLVYKASGILQTVESLKSYSETWLENYQLFQVLENVKLNELKEALQSNFVQNFIESQVNTDVDQLLETLKDYENVKELSANDTAIEQITVLAQLMDNISSCVLIDRFKPMESEEDLEKKVHELLKDNIFLASILFDTNDVNESNTSRSNQLLSSPLPPQMKYTIRTNILHSMPTDELGNPTWVSQPRTLPTDTSRYNLIFIPLQDMIERAIIEIQTGQNAFDPAIQVTAMPYPCHRNDQFLNNIGFFLPLLMMLAWLVSLASLVRKLIFEKELRLEEYMKILGVKPLINFLTWFLDNFIILICSSILITIILKAGQILPNSNGFIIFLYFLDFGVSVISLGYMIAAFFSHANTGALSACLLYIITFFPYMVFVIVQNQLNFSSQILICLLSMTAFSQGTYIITLLEGEGSGIQWSNMYEAVGSAENVSFAWICWMIVIDSAIYLILGWYLHNVFPGKYGTRRPWYFPFTGSYWMNLCNCAKKHDRKIGEGYWAQNLNHYNQQMNGKDDPLNYMNSSGKEEGDTKLNIGVAVRSLTKVYKHNKKVAIKDLNLDFYKGEITALLGPNGAGKTTTMSMLTGMHQPSSGAIYIDGRNMNRDMSVIREKLGVCLQHDVLFETLTVREHLLLYGIIKAPQWTKEKLLQEVNIALENAGICQYQHKRVGTLSGGTKRKLSIAISFIGGSSTIILDEPTSGIDPYSRRNIWDIILKYREGRTIIFTTHHLDEADILSDRIIILEEGQLKCYGSPTYLKEKYGHDYSLVISKKPSAAGSHESCDVGLVTSLVKEHIPQAFLKENAFGELTYVIPTVEDKTAYENLWHALDGNMENLYLSGYRISDTTLEEVFMNLIQNEERSALHHDQDGESLKSESIESTENGSVPFAEDPRVTGISLIFKQMAALMIKRFHHARRDWKGAIATLLLPVLLLILAMALFSVNPLSAEYPSRRMSPDIYQDSNITFFSSGKMDFKNLTNMLLESLKMNEPCTGQASNRDNPYCWSNGPLEPEYSVDNCYCEDSYQKCPTKNITVPYFMNNEGSFLYNVTGYNLNDYLLSTENVFGKKRLGGWSFGEELPNDLKGSNFTPSDIKSLVKIWYNQRDFHAEPAILNRLNNLILWASLPPGANWTQYGITLHSHPYRGFLLNDDKILENLRQCGVAFCILLGFSLLTASIGGYIVQDRITGQKRLQHISGLGYRLYWITNFLCDMILYLVPVVLSICVFAAFQFSAFTSRENLGATALLLILFGFATLPWMYLFSRFFTSSDTAFITYTSMNLVLGLCTILATYLPRFLGLLSNDEHLLRVYSVLRWVFIIFPQFCLSFGLIELSYNQLKFDLTEDFGIDSYVNPFKMEYLGWIFVAITLEGCLFFLIRLLFQEQLLHKLRFRYPLDSINDNDEDEDVKRERQRVLNGEANTDVLQIHNLKKCYHVLNKNVRAVRGITVGVPVGECFGLLGVNGAGKTTTFKMLTGATGPSSGHATIRTSEGSAQDVCSRIDGTLLGYCPQQDALDDLLTGWEHLYYYARIRGIPERMIKKNIYDLAHRLHLASHVNEVVKTYSGGTKRKLSTALALMGRPEVLLLDEPSSGMDPESKRFLWKTILSEVEAGCSAVLTSHSMEECEALCSRLAIMVNGKFRCIGSPKHIRNRFGEFYSVKVVLNQKSTTLMVLTDLLTSHFPGTTLKEKHQYSLEYQVPQKEGDLAKMFHFLEHNKEQLNIKSYSISQATLDQVFINFARQLEEPLDQASAEINRRNLSV
ncbi:ATP-binding cassette sub-family A member 13-like isoform X2 [Narcine bancroftii]|uniref:ATP-binding cassette sub-family A member 13-like isoform X2 n=1 Tax=Narcine bancroftii TaxID=1343680 RepID=UPI00383223B2